ncbi:MAG: pullulanase-associated domain-containing protein [Anaeromyxobacter sp.]
MMKKLMMLCGLLAAVAFAPATQAEDLKLPEGQVAVHYFRADGSYDGWGLHVWESFQAKEEAGDEFALKEMSDRPLPGVTWFKPLPQSGKDDFGAYWLLPEKEFSNGRVNYILHKGDKKDQCNKDMFFLIKDSREIYINSGDCSIYTSKDAALKARK